jgi:hypothetical protein
MMTSFMVVCPFAGSALIQPRGCEQDRAAAPVVTTGACTGRAPPLNQKADHLLNRGDGPPAGGVVHGRVVGVCELQDGRLAAEADARPEERLVDDRGFRAGEATEDGAGGSRAQGLGRLAAHSQRHARRRRTVARSDDARIVHTRQRLIGQEATHPVGAQAAGGRQRRDIEPGRPDRHRTRPHRPATQDDGIGPHCRDDVGFEHLDPQGAQHPGRGATSGVR